MLQEKLLNSERGRQAGFTLISVVITTLLSGVVLLGAWTAYRNINAQWRIATIDREMDQYANMTLKEMTNLMGWGWCNQEIQGGSRTPRVKIYSVDMYNEEGNWRSGMRAPFGWRYYDRLASDSSFTLTFRPFLGVLLQGDEFYGTEDFGYQWVGRAPSSPNEMRVMTANDRMSIVGLEFDWPAPEYFGYDPNDRDQNKHKGVMTVAMTLQYRYRAPSSGGAFSGLFSESYVHERTYKTQIYMRNWEIPSNQIRDRVYPKPL